MESYSEDGTGSLEVDGDEELESEFYIYLRDNPDAWAGTMNPLSLENHV